MEQMSISRAEWLACLGEAIAGAQTVAWRLRTYESSSLEARELYDRLESARQEIESLRGIAGAKPVQADLGWLDRLGWSGALTDSPD